MTINHLGLASVNNISRFLKCINYKQVIDVNIALVFNYPKHLLEAQILWKR